MRGARVIAAGLLGSVIGLPAIAHHGWGGYEAATPLTLTGTIRQVSFENPHGTIRLLTADKEWEVVLAPPYRMVNRGLTQEMLQVGISAAVYGYPSRQNATEMRAERITLAGKTTELR